MNLKVMMYDSCTINDRIRQVDCKLFVAVNHCLRLESVYDACEL